MEKTKHEGVSLRLSTETMDAIRAYRDAMATEKGIELSLTSAIRALLNKALRLPL